MRQEQDISINSDTSPQERQAAKKTVISFISAFKAYTLYPEDHSFSRNNLSKFKKDLDEFLQEYHELHIDIGRNSFLYKEELLFEGEPEENNPAYLLTRDGLLYLEFLKDVESNEISELLKILNLHRNPLDELGGDIVTSLWQANLDGIIYEEVDIFALESFDFDLSTMQVRPEEETHHPSSEDKDGDKLLSAEMTESHRESSDKEDDTTEKNGSPESNEPIHGVQMVEQGIKLLHLTPEEEYALRSFIDEEERKDHTNDVIDILLIILIVQKDKQNFDSVLEFLDFEFYETMEKGEFHLSYKLCNNILKIKNQIETKRPWAVPLIDDFFAALSLEERLGDLPWVKDINLLNQNEKLLKYLWQVFRFLTPDILLTLGPLMGRIPTDRLNIRNTLFEIIDSKAATAPEKLQLLLEDADESIILLLSPVIQNLPQADAAEIYLRMTHHSSAEVRKIGLDGYFLTERNPRFDELIHVLGDENHFVRDRALSYLVQAGNEIIETVLCLYLGQGEAVYKDPRHVLLCYETLSKYGSEKSIPFLKKTILEGKLTSMFSSLNTVHKKGAALTLLAIGTEEALNILQSGVKSMKPDIRSACQEALNKKQ